MLPLLARFLNYLSQARGEVYSEEHEIFPLFLLINKLQGDSWVCFLESQGVSSPSKHLTMLTLGLASNFKGFWREFWVQIALSGL